MYTRMSGIVTFDELVAWQLQLAADPAFDPTFPLLVDMRDVTEMRLTWTELKLLIVQSPVQMTTRRAILLGNSNVIGSAHVYESLRESLTASSSARVVYTLTEAAQWLGVDDLHSDAP